MFLYTPDHVHCNLLLRPCDRPPSPTPHVPKPPAIRSVQGMSTTYSTRVDLCGLSKPSNQHPGLTCLAHAKHQLLALWGGKAFFNSIATNNDSMRVLDLRCPVLSLQTVNTPELKLIAESLPSHCLEEGSHSKHMSDISARGFYIQPPSPTHSAR